MTTFKKTHKTKIKNQIGSQIPEFVVSDHPKFLSFLESYYLFMESAEISLESITAADRLLLETETTTDSYILLNQTDKNGLDEGGSLVQEENTVSGSFVRGEIITGATSGATSTILSEDIITNSRLFISSNNAFKTGEIVTGANSGATATVKKYRANPVENIQQLLNYSDPDHTISDSLSQMKEEFLNTIPTNMDASIDQRKLVKNIKSLYRAKGTAKANQAFFKILFNEDSVIYTPTDDMLRVSDGKWNTQTFLRCTQTTAQSVNDPIELVGQTITQANNPSNASVSEATAIVENILKFQEGTTQIVEIIINEDTTTGTFVNGEVVSGVSNVNEDLTVKLTVSQALSTATITNDGSTLTVGDEATLSGGAGSGGRVQVLDISGAGVTEVITNAAGTGYQEGDTITFSSGTAEAEVSVVNGGFAPETGSVDIHVELESGTISGSGSGDLLLEDAVDNGRGGKFLDSASQMVDREIKIELEGNGGYGTGHILSEEDDVSKAERFYIVNQDSEPDVPYNIEADEHIVLEDLTQVGDRYLGDKLVQENTTGSGDITDIRMIASGSGYTTLPTATISGDRFIALEDATDTTPDGISRIEFETGGQMLQDTAFDGASATVIPFGDEIGRATSLTIIEHGIDYTSAPSYAFPKYAVLKTVSGTISADETFTSNISGATGTVVDFTAPLLKYTATTSELEVGDTVTFSGSTTATVSKSDNLTGSGTIGTTITTQGRYLNQDGHISEGSKKIQDSLYYQDYSYVVKVARDIAEWRDALKRAVHPSGFYVTGQVDIVSRLNGKIKSPVAATLSGGLFSGTSDTPIYMRLNTLFSTFFGRRTGVGLKSMSNGVELDGKTKVSSAVARTGIAVEPQNDYRDTNTNTQKELNLSPETTIELEKRNRNSFYSLNSYTARGTSVSNGYAYAGPRLKTLSRFGLSAYAANNAIVLEGGTETGKSELLLETSMGGGVLQIEHGASFSTTLKDWANLRFTGSLNTSVDGETVRLSDINGSTSNQNHKTNLTFPAEVTTTPT